MSIEAEHYKIRERIKEDQKRNSHESGALDSMVEKPFIFKDIILKNTLKTTSKEVGEKLNLAISETLFSFYIQSP